MAVRSFRGELRIEPIERQDSGAKVGRLNREQPALVNLVAFRFMGECHGEYPGAKKAAAAD